SQTARQEIPSELRRDVRLLGDMLGRVIADYGGPNLLRDVERLRSLVIRGREDGRFERQAERLVASWKLERAELVARAFSVYFHLANLAEEHQRARVIRERDRGPEPLPESIAATVDELRPRLGRKRLRDLVAGLEVHPVFTAHPTESRRRAVVTAIRRVGDQLERLDDPRTSDSERADATRRLAEEIDTLWRTSQVRVAHVQPLDEVRSFMAVFDETLFRLAPEVVRALDDGLGGNAPAFLRFGSWIGGDRDGNPSITAQVTDETMSIHAEHALLARGEVQHLIWQAETFGCHLAELEIRQHSQVLRRALDEVRARRARSELTRDTVDLLGVMDALQRRFGVESCRRFVVSFTRSAADVAAVYELAHEATGGKGPTIDAVPLFETLEDLGRATAVMDEVIQLPAVRGRLAANGRAIEVMLGYSDSAKEIGPLSATLALHDAQAALTAWARKRRLRLTLFHGRGGALGRGGGPANRAVRAQAPGS